MQYYIFMKSKFNKPRLRKATINNEDSLWKIFLYLKLLMVCLSIFTFYVETGLLFQACEWQRNRGENYTEYLRRAFELCLERPRITPEI